MTDEGKWPIPENLPEGTYIQYPEQGGMLIKNKHVRGNLPGTHLPNSITTSERGRELSVRRKEVTKQKTRAAILAAAQEMAESGDFKLLHGKKLEFASDVFSEAAAMLFKDIVMTSGVRPEARLAAFDKLGRLADVIGDDNEEKKQEGPIPQSMLTNASRILLAIEYAKENPELSLIADGRGTGKTEMVDAVISASRNAEPNVVENTEKKQWI
jgi:hypothetical protein